MMIEVKVFLDEGDTFDGKGMAEYLLRYLMREGIAGGSMFRDVMGFGSKRHLHMPRRFGASDESPIMLLFIDEEEKVQAVLPRIREVLGPGLITMQQVEVYPA